MYDDDDDDDDQKGFTLFKYNDVTAQACRKGVGAYVQHSTKHQVHLLLLLLLLFIRD
jgi:hypothetical protein